MKFSVLMSVYKNEKPEFLRQSISSIIRQTLMPNEIVIVKDGILTDELNDVIKKFHYKYEGLFKVVSLKKNVGLGAALNIGLVECINNIVARMDSDDICLPNRFEKQIEYMEKFKDIDVIGAYIAEFRVEPENKVFIRKVPLDHKDIVKYAKLRNPLNHVTVVFRKEAVIKSGGYISSLLNEDYYLWVRMLLNGCKIMNLPNILVLVRANKEMYRRRGGVKYIKSEFKLEKKFLKLGFVNGKQFTKNMIIRTTVRLLPNKIRTIFYERKLRTKAYENK